MHEMTVGFFAPAPMPALKLPAENHIAFRIDTVELKNRLRDVETDCRDRFHGA
jgi:hypothetical protein